MDPNATLDQIRTITRTWKRQEFITGRDTVTLMELVTALDEWIVSGGFLPADWKAKEF